ncbi:restriction endonuclease subunit S [Pseudonocardia aurantiaca]|uniref:Restriction endonuclease subunit S n=1 Tax=Pseudonocardia aurantiaca TaxID=75290 RepID=A0ABW4FNJ5_9PSEU
MTSLLHLADYVNGLPFTSNDFSDRGIPVVRIRQLIDSSSEPDLVDGPVPPKGRVEDGDLIFSWSGSLAVRIWDRGPAALNQHLFNVRPRAGVDKRWLRWLLESKLDQFRGQMHGSAMTHLTMDMLRSVRVDLPDLGEQRRVADFLDAETARLDSLASVRLQAVKLAQERFEAFVDLELTGGSVDYEPLRRAVDGLTVGVVVNPSTYVDPEGDVLFFRGVDVSPFVLAVERAQRMSSASNRLLRKSILRCGDIVSVRVGEPGVSAVVPPEANGSNCASVMITRPGERVDSDFLCHVYNSRFGRSQWQALSVGAAQRQVNVSAAGDFRIPHLSIMRQRDLACAFEKHRVLVSELSKWSARQVCLMTERRRALITGAVNGQLDVTTAREMAI